MKSSLQYLPLWAGRQQSLYVVLVGLYWYEPNWHLLWVIFISFASCRIEEENTNWNLVMFVHAHSLISKSSKLYQQSVCMITVKLWFCFLFLLPQMKTWKHKRIIFINFIFSSMSCKNIWKITDEVCLYKVIWYYKYFKGFLFVPNCRNF